MLLNCKDENGSLSPLAVSILNRPDSSKLSPEDSVKVLHSVDWVKLVSDQILKHQNSLFEGCSTIGELAEAAAQELRECFDGVTATVEAMSDEEIKLMEAQVAAD